MPELEKLIASVPVVVSDDSFEEQTRHLAMCQVRRAVANRWNHLFALKDKLPLSDWERLRDEVSGCMASFVEQNDAEIIYAPDMKDLVLAELGEGAPLQDTPQASDQASSSSSQRSCVPHEFRWLELRDGVWTVMKACSFNQNWDFRRTRGFPWNSMFHVLQVEPEHHLDGYACYYACSEWWCWQTPFTQWFTKSFCLVALPFAQELGLSPGHVSCINLTQCPSGTTFNKLELNFYLCF